MWPYVGRSEETLLFHFVWQYEEKLEGLGRIRPIPLSKHYPEMTKENKDGIFLIVGDELLVKEQTQKLIRETLDPALKDTNLTVLDGSGLDVSKLIAEIFTPSLFGGKRVILVSDAPIFMGRVEKSKTLTKALDAWKANNKDTALKALAQLLSWAGVDRRRLESGTEWIEEIAGSGATSSDKATFIELGQAFLESGKDVRFSAEEALIEEILTDDFPEDAMLIFTADKADKRKKIYKAVRKRGRIIECEVRQERFGSNVERAFFEERVKDVLDRAKKKITRDGMDTMYSRSGLNMRQLNAELEKLVQYVGVRKEITKRDVEELFGDFSQAAFYEINAALRTGDLTSCLRALHEHNKVAEHPLQSLAMVANDFKKLMAARELLFTVFKPYWKKGMSYRAFQSVLQQVRDERPEITGKNGHPFLNQKDYPIYLYLKDAQKFPMDRLVDIMQAILETDILLKSSRTARTAPNIVMERLVLRICGVG